MVDGRDDASGQEHQQEEGLVVVKTVRRAPPRKDDKAMMVGDAAPWGRDGGETQGRGPTSSKKRPPQSPTRSTTTTMTAKPSCPWEADVPRNKPRVATPVPASKRPRLTPRDSPLKHDDDHDVHSQQTNQTKTGPKDDDDDVEVSNANTTATGRATGYSSHHSASDRQDTNDLSSRRDSLFGDILCRRDSLFGASRRGSSYGAKAVFPVHDLTSMRRSASSSFVLDDSNNNNNNNNEDELWLLAGSVFPIAASAASAVKKSSAAKAAASTLQQQHAPQEISPSTPKKQHVQCPSVAPPMPAPPRASYALPHPRYSPTPIVQQQQQQPPPRLLFSKHVQQIWSAKISAPQRTDILVATLPVTKTAAHRWRVHYEKDHPPTSTTLWKMILKCADALGCRNCRRDFEYNNNAIGEAKGFFLGREKWHMLRQNLIAYFEHEAFVKRHLHTVRPLPREQQEGQSLISKAGTECLVCCERYHRQDVTVCTGTGKHGLCRCCLRSYVMEDSPARDLKCVVCPQLKCTSMLPPAAIRENLSTWDKLRFQEKRDAEFNNSIMEAAASASPSYSSSHSPPPSSRDVAVASPTAETAWSCECGASGIVTEHGIASGRVCCTGCRLEFCVHCGHDWHTGDCPAPTTNEDDEDDDAQWQRPQREQQQPVEHERATHIPSNFCLAPAASRPSTTTVESANAPLPHEGNRNYYFYYTPGRREHDRPAAGPMRPLTAAATATAAGRGKAVAHV
jgi:hypothetical protein